MKKKKRLLLIGDIVGILVTIAPVSYTHLFMRHCIRRMEMQCF